jgi:hypothetical protein
MAAWLRGAERSGSAAMGPRTQSFRPALRSAFITYLWKIR